MNKIYYDGNLTDFVIRLGQMVFCDLITIVVKDGVRLSCEFMNTLNFWSDTPISINFEYESKTA